MRTGVDRLWLPSVSRGWLPAWIVCPGPRRRQADCAWRRLRSGAGGECREGPGEWAGFPGV